MFKLRPGGQGPSGPAQPPSIDAVRRRARHRLIGASVLVLAGVIGFPLLFDTQPRPIPVDIPIVIPDRQTAPPLVAAEPVAAAPVAPVTPSPVVTAPPEPAPTPPEPAPAPAPAPTVAAKVPAAKEAARAQALLEGKSTAAAVRVVVQVGAYADAARAQEVRQRLERAGLKTYTHVATTPQGPRTRVRLGPFDTRAEAEKAADKVKALGLPAVILTL